jgi:hypothetical protein
VKARGYYAIAALVIFAVEVVIALYVRDDFVRPYLGDLLAVMLVYCAVRAVMGAGMFAALGFALGLALAIEVAQLFDVLGALGLGGNRVARIVLGGSFDVLDLAAYAAGGVAIIVVEAMLRRR